MEAFLFIFVFIVVIGVAMAMGKARQQELTQFAESKGWTYKPSEYGLAKKWRADVYAGTPFAAGSARDIVEGSHGLHRFTAFTSTVSSGSSDTADDVYGVIVLQLQSALPDLAIIRESFGQAIAKLFGGTDIQIGQPAFDSEYRVVADDPQYAKIFLGPDLVAWLMAPGRLGQPYLIQGGDLLTWHNGSLKHEELDRWLNDLVEFTDHINPDIWGMYGKPLTTGELR